MPVVGWISHKGGTGRSVTLANAAYHLACSNKNVVIVDLDLASPTMGSVLGLSQVERGARKGTHNILSGECPPIDVEELLISVWDSEMLVQPALSGDFQLLPGARGVGDFGDGYEYHPERLGDTIRHLNRAFDYVLIDLRSGLSTIASEFVGRGREAGLIDLWIVLHRRTGQHMVGAAELLEKLSRAKGGTQRRRVVTAYVSPETVSDSERAWVEGRDAELVELERNNLLAPFPEVGPPLVVVPDELMLRLQEGIVTPAAVSSGMARQATFDAYEHLARKLIDLSVGAE